MPRAWRAKCNPFRCKLTYFEHGHAGHVTCVQRFMVASSPWSNCVYHNAGDAFRQDHVIIALVAEEWIKPIMTAPLTWLSAHYGKLEPVQDMRNVVYHIGDPGRSLTMVYLLVRFGAEFAWAVGQPECGKRVLRALYRSPRIVISPEDGLRNSVDQESIVGAQAALRALRRFEWPEFSAVVHKSYNRTTWRLLDGWNDIRTAKIRALLLRALDPYRFARRKLRHGVTPERREQLRQLVALKRELDQVCARMLAE